MLRIFDKTATGQFCIKIIFDYVSIQVLYNYNFKRTNIPVVNDLMKKIFK